MCVNARRHLLFFLVQNGLQRRRKIQLQRERCSEKCVKLATIKLKVNAQLEIVSEFKRIHPFQIDNKIQRFLIVQRFSI